MTRGTRLRKAIDAIAHQHPKHYLGRIWRWAAKQGEYKNNPRWKAARAWAHMHRKFAFKKSHHFHRLQKRLADSPRRHRAYLRSRIWAARGRHWLHIEVLYRQEQRRLKKRHIHHTQLPSGGGLLVSFDGRSVAGWIVRDSLVPARASGYWSGVAFSGYRTKEYSQSLCYAMCGQPSCPGMCAGLASNHACPASYTCREFEGAVDVSDSYGLSRFEAAHGYPTRHVLPNDLPHHSRTGQ